MIHVITERFNSGTPLPVTNMGLYLRAQTQTYKSIHIAQYMTVRLVERVYLSAIVRALVRNIQDRYRPEFFDNY